MSWLSEIELNKSTFFPLSGQMFCQKRLPESCGCARVRDDLLPRCPRVVRRRRRLIRRGRLRLNVSVSPAAEKPAVQIGCSGWGGCLTVDRANVLSKTFAVMLWLCKGAGRSVARGSEGGPKTGTFNLSGTIEVERFPHLLRPEIRPFRSGWRPRGCLAVDRACGGKLALSGLLSALSGGACSGLHAF